MSVVDGEQHYDSIHKDTYEKIKATFRKIRDGELFKRIDTIEKRLDLFESKLNQEHRLLKLEEAICWRNYDDRS